MADPIIEAMEDAFARAYPDIPHSQRMLAALRAALEAAEYRSEMPVLEACAVLQKIALAAYGDDNG